MSITYINTIDKIKPFKVHQCSIKEFIKLVEIQTDQIIEGIYNNKNNVIELLTNDVIRLFFSVQGVNNIQLLSLIDKICEVFNITPIALSYNKYLNSYNIYYDKKVHCDDIMIMLMYFNCITHNQYFNYFNNKWYNTRLVDVVGMIIDNSEYDNYYKVISGNVKDTIIQNIENLLEYDIDDIIDMYNIEEDLF